MSTIDIVQKLWNLCNVLRDDGITYQNSLEQYARKKKAKQLNSCPKKKRNP